MGLLSDITDSLFGGAGGRAADAQGEAGAEALAFLQAQADRADDRLTPFRATGEGAIPLLLQTLNQPGQMAILENNPLFKMGLQNLNEQTNAFSASRGRFGAGDTATEIFQNAIAAGSPLINDQFRRALETVRVGGAAAAGSAATASNLGGLGAGIIGGIGDSRAAGIIGDSNVLGGTLGGFGRFLGGQFG